MNIKFLKINDSIKNVDMLINIAQISTITKTSNGLAHVEFFSKTDSCPNSFTSKECYEDFISSLHEFII